MTTPAEAISALRDEVEDRIVALTPNRMVNANEPFTLYTSQAEKPITEWTGSSRVFAIGAFTEVRRWNLGYSQQQILYTAPITFVYRRTPIWNLAALDDMHQVQHDLLNNVPSVSGVANRWIPPTESPVVTMHAEQPWDYYTMTLNAYLSVTAT